MKNLKNLGEILNKQEQQAINGGWAIEIIYQSCGPNGECPGDYYCNNGFCVDYHIK